MTADEQKKIQAWARDLGDGARLKLLTTQDPRSRDLAGFCDALAENAPGLHIIRESETWNPDLPGLWIGDRICYRAVPLGTELDPFLAALARSAAPAGISLDPATADRLRRMALPADLTLYVTGQCPFCPAVVRRLTAPVLAGDRLRLFVMDGELFPEKAREDNITSAPTVILDNAFRWTGPVDLNEILDMAVDRDPALLGGPTLERMIEEGEAFRLADMMRESGAIFPAFVPLLMSTDMKVRLGAMAAAESLAEQDIGLTAAAIPALRAAYSAQTDQVKGDVLYLMGLFGAEADIPWIERAGAAAAHPDVRDAAGEALESIRRRQI